MSYLAWKLIHISSVVIFLGNIITGIFWAAHANKTRDFSQISSTFQGIIKSDRWFTLPGVFGILISGFAVAGKGNFSIFGTGWIVWGLILFGVSGLVFSIWVAPLQRKIADFTLSQECTEQTWQTYQELFKKWEWWGLLALGTPVAAFVIMILKPAIPEL